MHKKRFALALLCGLGMSGAAQATPLPYYAVPSYYGTANVATEPSLAPITYLNSAAGVSYTDVPLGSSTPSGFSPSPTIDSISLINHETQASALYGAGAGTLHAAASAAVGALGSNLGPLVNPAHGASAQARAMYYDYALVQGPAGASGTATLQFVLHLDGSIFAGTQGAQGISDKYGVVAQEGAIFGVPSNQAGISCLPSCSAAITSDTGYNAQGPFNNVFSNSNIFTVLAAYGTVLEMYANLNVSASAFGDATEGGTATALYYNTMHTYIDVLTPGVSLLTSSGNDYSSAPTGGTTVPEPTTLALMGLGLSGLGWTRRRKA
jgi:hypothetical protein